MELQDSWSEELTATAKEGEKSKLFRKWAFTVNCDLLNDTRLNDISYYVEGHDLTNTVNSRNKNIRTTIWIGALEPKEFEKKDNYNHRHCAIENTGGGISKMNALTQLAKYLNIDCKLLTCGHGCVISYSQPIMEWPSYKAYMFKTLPGRLTSDEEKIQQAVIHLRRTLKKNPTPVQVKQYLVQGNIIAFRKVATGAIKQQIELACELGDVYKSSGSEDGDEDNDDGLKFLSKLARLDDATTVCDVSSGFFDDILEILVKQLKMTTLRDCDDNPPLKRIFEIIAMMIMPLFIKRNNNDHKTKSLVFYGLSQTGKSFMLMNLVKSGKLHQVSSDAKGVGRFDAPISCNGFYFDDANDKILMSSDTITIKNLTAGDEASVKIYSKSASVRGWTFITCQTPLQKAQSDDEAWNRRLVEICFDNCEVFKEYTTVFDMVKRSNVDEMLTFLYYVLHKPKMATAELILRDFFIQSEYYDSIITSMFDKLKHGNNLLRLLNLLIVKIEKTFV